jgi:hypothetical protein
LTIDFVKCKEEHAISKKKEHAVNPPQKGENPEADPNLRYRFLTTYAYGEPTALVFNTCKHDKIM